MLSGFMPLPFIVLESRGAPKSAQFTNRDITGKGEYHGERWPAENISEPVSVV
jgi:hypothetical protein